MGQQAEVGEQFNGGAGVAVPQRSAPLLEPANDHHAAALGEGLCRVLGRRNSATYKFAFAPVLAHDTTTAYLVMVPTASLAGLLRCRAG